MKSVIIWLTVISTVFPASSLKDMKTGVSISGIVNAYLEMKNALTEDNSASAATAGKRLADALKSFDKTSLTMDQKKVYNAIESDAIENADHISKNSGNIEHQRAHFEMLSKNIYDLIKGLGATQILYKDFDPMFNNGEGAFWISETKEIRNPYMGKSMLTSGSVKEEIKP
jgi:hypothetical protein